MRQDRPAAGEPLHFFLGPVAPIVDLQADEPVGGNIALPGNARQFHLEANFMTGGDKGGEALQIESVEYPRQGASQ